MTITITNSEKLQNNSNYCVVFQKNNIGGIPEGNSK